MQISLLQPLDVCHIILLNCSARKYSAGWISSSLLSETNGGKSEEAVLCSLTMQWLKNALDVIPTGIIQTGHST